MGLFGSLGLLLQANRAKGAVEREIAMGWDWKKSLAKAASELAKHAFTALLAGLILVPDNQVHDFLISVGVPPAVAATAVPLVMAAIRYLSNSRKVKAALAGGVLVAFLIPGPLLADDSQPPQQPLSASLQADETGATVIDVQTWTLAVLTRDERREYAGGRVTLDAPAGPVRLFARADITGTQDGHDFDFGAYQTFRSVEVFGGARYPFRSGVALAVAGGVSYSIEGADGPADPRLYSLLALVRVPLPAGGYAYVGGGHRGPVGGLALVGSVSYPAGPTRLLVDYDFPLTVDTSGQARPWVLKTGVAVPLKRWVIR